MTELTLSTGHPIALMPAAVKKYRGTRLPGASLLQYADDGLAISFHEYQNRLFRFSLRNISPQASQSIVTKESSNYLRIEVALTGELPVANDDSQITLIAGQYHITNSKVYRSVFAKGAGCLYLVIFVSPELLLQSPVGKTVVPTAPATMNAPMRELVNEILDNPFEEHLREGFYDQAVRKLLFDHASRPPYTPPGDLSPRELAAVYAADQIIAQQLDRHYSVHELARLTHTNVHVLKTGFARVFGMGTFERLLQRKMDRAKYLLEATDKQIQEVSADAGYETVTGFINAFRKQFRMTPKDWRKKSRGLL